MSHIFVFVSRFIRNFSDLSNFSWKIFIIFFGPDHALKRLYIIYIFDVFIRLFDLYLKKLLLLLITIFILAILLVVFKTYSEFLNPIGAFPMPSGFWGTLYSITFSKGFLNEKFVPLKKKNYFVLIKLMQNLINI